MGGWVGGEGGAWGDKGWPFPNAPHAPPALTQPTCPLPPTPALCRICTGSARRAFRDPAPAGCLDAAPIARRPAHRRGARLRATRRRRPAKGVTASCSGRCLANFILNMYIVMHTIVCDAHSNKRCCVGGLVKQQAGNTRASACRAPPRQLHLGWPQEGGWFLVPPFFPRLLHPLARLPSTPTATPDGNSCIRDLRRPPTPRPAPCCRRCVQRVVVRGRGGSEAEWREGPRHKPWPPPP